MGTRLTLALALLACILPCLARRSDGDYRMPTLHGYYNKRNQTQSCCSALASRLEGEVYYPGDSEYANQQNGTEDGYWSALASIPEPACRATPKHTKDVAVAVTTLVEAQCKFAVRGGGHMTWAGAANIQDGVTVDLTAMTQVHTNGSVTSVGGGARWRDVYPKLDQLQLAVVGGRNSPVGVGGLITGGGNSYFGPIHGFACDNVLNFEVVLASGETVQANADENPDLHRALKGGSNNFGIVTRFDLKTFPLTQVWSGVLAHPTNTVPQQYRALQDFTTASGDGVDPYASVMTVNVWSGAGHTTTVNSLFYAKPEADPPILKNFTEIQPSVFSTLRIANLTNITSEYDESLATVERGLFSTITVGNNAPLFERIFQIADFNMAPLFNKTGFGASLNIQPISRATTGKANMTGGNSLGLSPDEGDATLVQASINWSSPADDAEINTVLESIIEQSTAAAREAGLYRDYIDLTHALPSQDPLRTYGADNLARLRATAKKYDPKGVFQKLVPGGFKLDP